MFVLVHYRPFAWIAFADPRRDDGRRAQLAGGQQAGGQPQATATWKFPPRLVVLHGLAVTLAIALTVLTAISASR